MRNSERVRIRQVNTLSDDWYLLKKTTFDYRMRDGSWKIITRETYDRGNGAAILLINRKRGTVLLTRQFRFPAYVNGSEDGMLIEACAGLLDNQSPEEAIRREAEEELGGKGGRGAQGPRDLYEPGISNGKTFLFCCGIRFTGRRRCRQ